MAASFFFQWTGAAFEPCAALPLTDRGFRYGMALFESIAVRGGRAEFLEAHLARLDAACRQCGWPVENAALRHAGKQLERLAQSSPDPLFARLYLTAGDGGPADPVTAPRVFVFAEPRPRPVAHSLCVRLHPAPFLPPLGGLKTANYWPNAEALRQARQTRADEALLFTPSGELISACMANVFLEVEGQWITPPLGCGARAGVTREWVMRRREIAEGPVHRDDLNRATACFLTSCWAGPVPVSHLEERALDPSFAMALSAEFFGEP